MLKSSAETGNLGGRQEGRRGVFRELALPKDLPKIAQQHHPRVSFFSAQHSPPLGRRLTRALGSGGGEPRKGHVGGGKAVGGALVLAADS